MSGKKLNHEKPENHYCHCQQLQPGSCGLNPPYHGGVCCVELTPEQFAEANKRGWYAESDKGRD